MFEKKPKERVVEVVVVHGMGMQKPAQTLVEWAEPLLRRIDWIARQQPIGTSNSTPNGVTIESADSLTMRPLAPTQDDPIAQDTAVVFDGVSLGASGAEVNALVPYLAEGAPRLLRLKITEAHWADSFLPMTRSEIFEWGAGFAARALFRIGRYFTRMTWFGVRAIPWRFPLLVTIPAVWLLLLLLAGILAITLPFLGPIFLIPGVKKVLSPIMDTLAEFVGDAAVWGRRPVRAAALRDVVRKRTAEARDRLGKVRGDKALFILAHSEGSTISADMLFSNTSGEKSVPVDGLFTMGSAVTLLGSSKWSQDGKDEDPDQTEDPDRPRNLIRAWAKNAPGTIWHNFWGIWDPVPSGPISTGEDARRQRWMRTFGLAGDGKTYIGPAERPVHNTALPFTDHQSYSGNIQQVVDPVSRHIMGIRSDDAPDVTTLRNRQHVHGIRSLGAQRMLIVGSAALAFLVPAAFAHVAGWLEFLAAWLRDRLLLWPWLVERGTTDKDGLPDLIPDNSVFSLAWLNEPLRVGVVAIAFVVLAVYLNERLVRKYLERVSWNDNATVPSGVWAGGLVWRVLLAVLFAYVAGWVTHDAYAPGWWTVIAVTIAIYSLYAPFVVEVPKNVAARRVET